MTKKARNKVIMVVLFSLIAIAFAVLHVVGLIKNLDSYLAMTNMSYFIGIAMMYLGSYHKDNHKYTSMKWCYGTSFVLIVISIVFLVYGLATGEISLFL